MYSDKLELYRFKSAFESNEKVIEQKIYVTKAKHLSNSGFRNLDYFKFYP